MSDRTNALKEPVSKRELTTREKIILLEGSKLHGLVFPPWKAPPEPTEFQLSSDEAPYLYLDNENLPLSASQIEIFHSWRRPGELHYQERDDCDNALGVHQRTLDLVQDVVSDCSVVASLCAVITRRERGKADIWVSAIYPYDKDSKQPAASSNGKYVFRFHFNGCYRRVVIDNRLPCSRTSQALHVVDRNDTGIYWPALVEKAYLKVRGGYDFPGSNSGTDLWILTGWIPEQLFLQSDDMDCDAMWRRVLKAFNYGDVLITMGTGKLTESEERGLGLAGEHDYSVIDVQEARGQRLFLVKNPWSNGQIWKGHIRYQDPITSSEESTQASSVHDSDLEDPSSNGGLTLGTFWMPLNDVFQSFESIYLNWNPALFSYRQDVHFKWDLSESYVSDGCLWSNPQYRIRSDSASVVWLLLSRHLSSPPAQEPVKNDSGFISLYAFNHDGQRVVLSDDAVAHGPYVDSPNALLKVDLRPCKALTAVVSEQTLPRKVTYFSLSAFSFAPLELAPASEKYIHKSVLYGTWTAATSGGNTGSPLYHVNPQFSISLNKSSDISLLLCTTEDWSVQVNLVWASGKQIRAITTSDVLGDSGEYRKGCAFAEIRDVPAGTYTIVCSTFEQGQTGKFRLSVGSLAACQVDQVVVPTAGRFVTNLQPVVWTPRSDCLIAPLMTRRLNRMTVSAMSGERPGTAGQQHCSPLKVSIEQGRGPTRRIIAVSGGGDYSVVHRAGVHTPDVDILPEMCAWQLWIVLSRLGSSGVPHDDHVEVQVMSDGSIEVGAWLQDNSCKETE